MTRPDNSARSTGLYDPAYEHDACGIGLVARLGFARAASAVGELAHYPVRLPPAKVVLEASGRRRAVAGDPVQKRLSALAAAMGRKGEIQIG